MKYHARVATLQMTTKLQAENSFNQDHTEKEISCFRPSILTSEPWNTQLFLNLQTRTTLCIYIYGWVVKLN